MIKATVDDLLDGTLDEMGMESLGHNIYIVRDGDTVFYVGQSGDPIDRLLTHLGRGTRSWCAGPSSLGQLIVSNLPESGGWQIELMILGDCEPYINTVWPWMKRFSIRGDDWEGLAEKAMIRTLHPCLNTTHNENPIPLPKHYNPGGEAHQYMK